MISKVVLIEESIVSCPTDDYTCSAFRLLGYEDRIEIAEYLTCRTEPLAVFHVDRTALDIEDLWVHLQAAYDDHVADCVPPNYNFGDMVEYVASARAAAKAGGDSNVVQAILQTGLAPDPEIWIWRDFDKVLAETEKLAASDVAVGRRECAWLADYMTLAPFVISHERKEKIAESLSAHYDIANGRIFSKTRN